MGTGLAQSGGPTLLTCECGGGSIEEDFEVSIASFIIEK